MITIMGEHVGLSTGVEPYGVWRILNLVHVQVFLSGFPSSAAMAAPDTPPGVLICLLERRLDAAAGEMD